MRTLLMIATLALIASPQLHAQHRTSESGLEFRVNPAAAPKQRSPVVFLLHGRGGRIGHWGAWETHARSLGYIVVVPQSIGDGGGQPGVGKGWGWGPVDMPKLAGLAREIQRTHNGDPTRTYVVGHSNGGFHACVAALQHPETFAAFCCIGGGNNVRSIGEAQKRVGAYFIHGTADTAVDFKWAKQGHAFLKEQGLKTELIVIEGGGHGRFTEKAPAFYTWVKAFSRPFTPGALDWPTGDQAALDAAKQSGKLTLVYFHAAKDQRSDAALGFERLLLADAKVSEALAELGIARLKIDRDAGKEAKRLRVRSATLLLLHKGRVRFKLTKLIPRDMLLARLRKEAERAK